MVLEGGGVKGAALVGSLNALENHGYAFKRIAGTSAGAIVGSMLAAGMTPAKIKLAMEEDFRQFQDVARVFKHAEGAGEAFGLLFKEGMFLGNRLHEWITKKLSDNGVKTWADLRDEDAESALPPERRYKLVVIVSDVSQGRMLRLPWDYKELLGVDPDEQPVADAVRASASIPFFFRPFKLPVGGVFAKNGDILCVDGGMLSNFPVDIFDRDDGKDPRWPTFGIKLSANAALADEQWAPTANNLEFSKSLLSTMMGAHDRAHVDDHPGVQKRTIFVDTTGFKATDFELTGPQKVELYTSGWTSAQKFLKGWTWP
ncbi:patatin-like phospholipase family protein [Arthrobacter sp. efr-133-TYG-118]|uniref:patatin-like phospholipase family protein n=1 Tax=Arthrobacter sp. efr-133-TYG-118 TaxID=3040279 RepID=UPI00254D3B3D|nr:patatin-like phospholipase family protein [Arthrobacter sp. efr-133-TYG-118]